MVTTFFKTIRKRLTSWFPPSLDRGFTMIELLVAILISGILVTSLMAIVLELLTSDRREATNTETQQEMQAALEFIASEMREAVYIYDGACLEKARNECAGLFTAANPGKLPRPTNSVPVLAFWKLDPLPDKLQNDCRTPLPASCDSANPPDIPCKVPCLAGRTHTLVVYYLSSDNSDNRWKGKARILRYELPKYDRNGALVSGYVDPTSSGTNFSYWPLNTATDVNLQKGNPPANTQILVDFVDNTSNKDLKNKLKSEKEVTQRDCPDDYEITPPDSTLSASTSFKDVRSLYACVRVEDGGTGSTGSSAGAFNQKVVLFLRGNTSGKPGVQNNSEREVLPTLQTEVLNRGVRNKTPNTN